MAEFQEVMKQRERMCESFKTLEECVTRCPISAKTNAATIDDHCTDKCRRFCTSCYVEAEEIIMAWAKEHPIKTNKDKFKEVFGDGIIPNQSAEFWNAEYKEPKEA